MDAILQWDLQTGYFAVAIAKQNQDLGIVHGGTCATQRESKGHGSKRGHDQDGNDLTECLIAGMLEIHCSGK